jgi:hypothetical protein
MQTFLTFLQDLGWGVSIGIVVLVVGGCFVYFNHWGETKKEKAKRLARDASRSPDRSRTPKDHTATKPSQPDGP